MGITTMDNAIQDDLIYFLWHMCLWRIESTNMAQSKEPQLPHAHPMSAFGI